MWVNLGTFVLTEARPRGTDWMTPQSKTISSDEKQIGAVGAGREADGWHGPRENSGVPDMLCIFIRVTDTRVHLPAFAKISSICTLQTGSFYFL